MEKLKLNETPVRTSRNYNMNNIKLENIEIPAKIPSFNNVQITGDNSKVSIDSQTSKINLKYGLNKELLEQLDLYANQKLKLTIDSKTNKETIINFKLNEKEPILLDNIEINANEQTNATVIIKYETTKNVKTFHNAVIRTNAKKDANINIILINLVNLSTDNFISIQNNFEENSRINYTIVDFGGKNSVTNYYSNLSGDNSDNQMNVVYLGKESQIFDLNYIGELRGKKTNIDIEVQGALKDNAKKHFKGTIDFKKGCKKAKGNENEVCMLLSDTAKSLALPMLLCSEEDVEGNHSTATGKIGEKELFYIMSRGFEFKEAMKLMVRARFNKILDNIKNDEIKNEILQEIDSRLD